MYYINIIYYNYRKLITNDIIGMLRYSITESRRGGDKGFVPSNSHNVVLQAGSHEPSPTQAQGQTSEQSGTHHARYTFWPPAWVMKSSGHNFGP